MCKENSQFRIKEDYASIQQDINHRMKVILYDWIVCISDQFKLKERTIFLSLELVELFMTNNIVNKDDFQLVGVACLFMAAKYEEIYPPKIDDFCKSCDNYYSKQRIFEVETSLLKLLEFDMSRVISYDFFIIFAGVAHFDEKMISFGIFLLSICTLDAAFFQGDKSLVAFGLCYLLHKIFKTSPFYQKCDLNGEKMIRLNTCQGRFAMKPEDEEVWGENLDLHFKEEETRHCARGIFNCNSKFSEVECKYIYQKFKDQKFAGASRFFIVQKNSVNCN